jgi:hypothetical protein
VTNVSQRGRPVPQFFRSQRAKRGKKEGIDACGATVRGCVQRAGLRRNPKEVADCLKVMICLI